MSKSTGGSAFPNHADQSQTGVFPEPGMTLRDYFAAKAMPMLRDQSDARYSEWAKRAYKMADAMLQAREA